MARVCPGSVGAAVAASLLLAIGGHAAWATEAAEMTATYAAVGDVTRTPYGWADLCGRQPQECRVDVLDPVDLRLTPRTMQMLERVNAKVNASIVPVSNFDHWGTMLDHWDYPTDGKGDCKIYALWKRKLLMDLGMPRQALLMTIVRDLEGNGHTLLTVKTDHGDFVLDNMVAEIRPWDATGYTFIKRQSQSDPNVWVSVGPAEGRRVAGATGIPSGPKTAAATAIGSKQADAGTTLLTGRSAYEPPSRRRPKR